MSKEIELLLKKALDSIARIKGKDYAPNVHEIQRWVDAHEIQAWLNKQQDNGN